MGSEVTFPNKDEPILSLKRCWRRLYCDRRRNGNHSIELCKLLHYIWTHSWVILMVLALWSSTRKVQCRALSLDKLCETKEDLKITVGFVLETQLAVSSARCDTKKTIFFKGASLHNVKLSEVSWLCRPRPQNLSTFGYVKLLWLARPCKWCVILL